VGQLVLKFGPCRAGTARAFLNVPWAETFKSRVVLCPPDGLVGRPTHDTRPVKWAMPAQRVVLCRPMCLSRE
jgi:hypothetical protein